jgi:hypothetical protein
MFQLLMQVCTILLRLVVHDVHRWKLHQVKIPMQETIHLFEFRARSYGPSSGNCTDCFVDARKLQKTFGILYWDDLSHPTRRDVRSICTPCTPSYGIILIWEFLAQPHGIFFSTIACEFMEGSSSTPCVASSLWGCRHRRFIDTQFVLLVHSIPSCVGWFLESVVGQSSIQVVV